jgi:SHS2 domain-containing protein
VYRWLEHTSEAELWIEDETAEAVLVEAAIALGDLLGERSGGEPVSHAISARADDLPALLVEWLSELVYLAESDGFVPERVAEISLADSSVRATVAGRRLEPQSLVKGVTYHRLEMAQEGDGGPWRARVVLDV